MIEEMGIALVTRGAVTPMALRLPDDLTIEEWADAGTKIRKLGEGLRFFAGDWWIHAEKHYGEDASQYHDVIGLSKKSLQNAAWVASRFEPSRRREKLEWSHHEAVSSSELTYEQADKLLDMAEANEWTVKQLRMIAQAALHPEEDAEDQVAELAKALDEDDGTCPAEWHQSTCTKCGEVRG
jgi:hypothetical protein